MIIIKNEKEIELMRQGGKILSGILKKIIAEVKPGIDTGKLEEMACKMIKDAGGSPAFKGYKTVLDERPYPTALCTSINSEIVHAPALPPRMLKEGDIIGIDVGMEYPVGVKTKGHQNNNMSKLGGYFTDMAVTVPVGKVTPEIDKLIKTTKRSLELGIEKVKPGNSLNDIGKAIQEYAEENGFSVVRDLVGHGVGKKVHEDPQVPNFEIKFNDMKNEILEPGMTIAIEPMINLGSYRLKLLRDGFTIATVDNKMSAHFEHTVLVTEHGHEILTLFE